jgi:carbonic anhydrase/acetyltransferase-like protein (isoleucine patch superfamily)
VGRVARTPISYGVIHALPTSVKARASSGHPRGLWRCGTRPGLLPSCLIAIGAIVLDGVAIEEESIVAAGALVPPGTRVPRRTLMMGNPARPRRALTDADLEMIRRPTDNYVRLKDLYREGA